MRVLPAAACAVLVAVVATVTVAAAADAPASWPRFRGPNGQGLADAPNLPVQWTEKDYRWTVALPGGGHGSPVVWGERLFVNCADAATAKRILVCLKTADGSTLWTREFASRPTHLNDLNSYATTTPALDAGRVVVSWATEEDYPVVALDHQGKELWRRDLGPFKSQHGHGASPLVYDGKVIVTNDQLGPSFLIALDAATGKTLWQTERRNVRAAYSMPCVYRPEGGGPPQLIFTSTAHGVTGLDPDTGKVLWELADLFDQRIVGSPVIVSGLIIATCGTGGRGTRLVAVRPPSKPGGQAELAYDSKTDVPYAVTSLVRDGLVFLWTEGGVISCARGATGEILWRERLRANFYGSPVWAGGRLYAISTKGEVFVLEAADTFKLLATVPLGEKSHATPAVSGGRMFLRTWSHLYAIGE